VIAQAVGRAVAPEVPVARPLGEFTNAVLPAERVGESIALDVAAAGEPDERGLHRLEHLGHVAAQAVGSAVPRVFRKKRDLVDPERRGRGHGDDQPTRRGGIVGLERGIELLPLGGQTVDLGRGVDLAVLVFDGDGQRTSEPGRGPGVEREQILGAFLDGDALEPLVGHARATVDRLDLQP
jgi:hypothetical protein